MASAPPSTKATNILPKIGRFGRLVTDSSAPDTANKDTLLDPALHVASLGFLLFAPGAAENCAKITENQPLGKSK
jgi:hypothetical protein